MSEEESVSAISELLQFLDPKTRADVRHSAVAYIVGVSGTPEGPDLFQVTEGIVALKSCSTEVKNFSLTSSLCSLFELVPEDRPAIFSAFINVTSDDALTANFIIENSAVVSISARHCHRRDNFAVDAAKLLSNLSLHFSAKVYARISAEWSSFLSDAIDLLQTNDSESYVDYLGYIILNCTELPVIRQQICEKHIGKILPLISLNDRRKRRLIAVDIVRNLCFDDGKSF